MHYSRDIIYNIFPPLAGSPAVAWQAAGLFQLPSTHYIVQSSGVQTVTVSRGIHFSAKNPWGFLVSFYSIRALSILIVLSIMILRVLFYITLRCRMLSCFCVFRVFRLILPFRSRQVSPVFFMFLPVVRVSFVPVDCVYHSCPWWCQPATTQHVSIP